MLANSQITSTTLRVVTYVAATIALASYAQSQTVPSGGLDVPARNLPVPTTVSPQIQKLIGAPLRTNWNVLPATGAEWKPGTSAGGGLTLAMVLKAKLDKVPLPGAIAPGTPMSDVTKAGDTFQTNAMVDNILVSPDGFCDAGTKVYANGLDFKDPMLSPIYGDMKGFPPTILTSGTRDLLLSNTVRVHRKLRQAGIEATLQVFEGQSHAHYLRDDTAPETKEVFSEIARFFDRHLGK